MIYSFRRRVARYFKVAILIGALCAPYALAETPRCEGGDSCPHEAEAGVIDGRRLYVATTDHPEALPWDAALAACADLGTGWRLPTRAELRHAVDHGALAGSFKGEWYWSATATSYGNPWIRNAATGQEGNASHGNSLAVRCVRSEEDKAEQ